MAEIRPFIVQALRDFAETAWRPPVDIYRTPHGWLVKCDLAGVREEDIRVTLQGRQLIVSGVRRDWSIVEGCQAYSIEISYNRFERTIELPGESFPQELQLEYRDGMLLVAVQAGNSRS